MAHNDIKSSHRQHGASAVEFAFIVVMFLTLLFGIVEFGRLFFNINSVQEITRRAAREQSVGAKHSLNLKENFMKMALMALVLGFGSLSAFAEGPILSCEAMRQGPRSDGKPGYETIDQKSILTVIAPRMKATQLKGNHTVNPVIG